MSMIGHSLLNQIVNEQGVTKPSDILENLRLGVKTSLKQTGANRESKDGMDIALVAYYPATDKIEYSGAYNPLYLVRNGEVLETKANKQPIGIHFKEKPFENHELQLEKGDTFYIFSDGYVDQFGGPEGRKFRARPFKEMLVNFQDKGMEEQRVILDETIEAWKGGQAQVDDILVIGLRL